LYNPEAETIYDIMYARNVSMSSVELQPVLSQDIVSGLSSIDEKL